MFYDVRIYPSSNPDVNLIGFGNCVVCSGEDESIIDFVDNNGYAFRPAQEEPDVSASHKYLEVQPPLSPEHTQQLGALCRKAADPVYDLLLVMDYRADSNGKIVIQG